MDNTGTYHFTTLIEIDTLTGLPTGNTKPNLPSDPDYIAPITDVVACPLPTTTSTTFPGTTTTTTTSTSTTSTTTEFVEQIMITDVLFVIGNTYNIFFNSNFALSELYTQISVDGINWGAPILNFGLTSPQALPIADDDVSFYVRVFDVNGVNTVYSNIFYYDLLTPIISMPLSQTFSFSKSLSQVSFQGTASGKLLEALVYDGYVNSLSIPYGNTKILTLPNRGTITVHGLDVVEDYIVPLEEIQDMTFEFWPTGSDGLQPFSSFSTSFEYVVLDTDGHQSNPVTMVINFTAI